MKLLERLYRSPFGSLMSLIAHQFAKLQQPFMIYGYKDLKTKIFHKYTRVSSSVVILNKYNLSLADQVWVWHYSILDATEGLEIEKGVQIGAWVGIFTHGSENSVRLLGSNFVNIHNSLRRGYTRGSVRIGAYSFIGAGSVILPGVTIGKGCLIGAGTLVTKSVPDYSVVVGNPGKIRGSTIEIDKKFFEDHDYSKTYFDSDALELVRMAFEFDNKQNLDKLDGN